MATYKLLADTPVSIPAIIGQTQGGQTMQAYADAGEYDLTDQIVTFWGTIGLHGDKEWLKVPAFWLSCASDY